MRDGNKSGAPADGSSVARGFRRCEHPDSTPLHLQKAMPGTCRAWSSRWRC